MNYSKPPISIPDQILKLKNRGLIFNDESKAVHFLSHISYYRLRAYTYPFQDNNDTNHPFIKAVSFEDIIALYIFDRKLRMLVFDAIEKIEISFRTQIIYHYAMTHGSHWHLMPHLYNNNQFFTEQITSLQKEVDRSNETFIKHYKTTYSNPKEPPCWMSLEVTSMGLLSKLFSNLKRDVIKDKISLYFGVKDPQLLESWMFCMSILRNTCAHHGRIWNRRFPPIKLPKKPLNSFVHNRNIHANKLYATACCIQYILNIISPTNGFKKQLLALMKNCPLAQEKEMGFPAGWQHDKFWI